MRWGPNFLMIDSDECIDRTSCEAECAVDAIFSEDALPPAQAEFNTLNAQLAKQRPVSAERRFRRPMPKNGPANRASLR